MAVNSRDRTILGEMIDRLAPSMSEEEVALVRGRPGGEPSPAA